MMDKHNILIVGVGGQGTILASDILGAVAIAAGYDIKKTDTIGMAQRGGSVVSHVRIATEVYSPLIKEGDADILIAFEKLEAARWSTYLNPGALVILNDYAVPPLSVSLGTQCYPSNNEIREILNEKTDNIYLIDSINKTKQLGDVRTLNIYMLGFLSSFLIIESKLWRQCLSTTLPAKILDINLKAFQLGHKDSARVNLK